MSKSWRSPRSPASPHTTIEISLQMVVSPRGARTITRTHRTGHSRTRISNSGQTELHPALSLLVEYVSLTQALSLIRHARRSICSSWRAKRRDRGKPRGAPRRKGRAKPVLGGHAGAYRSGGCEEARPFCILAFSGLRENRREGSKRAPTLQSHRLVYRSSPKSQTP